MLKHEFIFLYYKKLWLNSQKKKWNVKYNTFIRKKLRKIEVNDKINESIFQIIENNMNKLAEGNTW